MFIDKKQAFRVAKQAAAAREFAESKARRQFRRAKSDKQPYKPGSLGLSMVSKAIQAEYGAILTRQQRRYLARKTGKSFQPFSAKA